MGNVVSLQSPIVFRSPIALPIHQDATLEQHHILEELSGVTTATEDEGDSPLLRPTIIRDPKMEREKQINDCIRYTLISGAAGLISISICFASVTVSQKNWFSKENNEKLFNIGMGAGAAFYVFFFLAVVCGGRASKLRGDPEPKEIHHIQYIRR